MLRSYFSFLLLQALERRITRNKKAYQFIFCPSIRLGACTQSSAIGRGLLRTWLFSWNHRSIVLHLVSVAVCRRRLQSVA